MAQKFPERLYTLESSRVYSFICRNKTSEFKFRNPIIWSSATFERQIHLNGHELPVTNAGTHIHPFVWRVPLSANFKFELNWIVQLQIDQRDPIANFPILHKTSFVLLSIWMVRVYTWFTIHHREFTQRSHSELLQLSFALTTSLSFKFLYGRVFNALSSEECFEIQSSAENKRAAFFLQT